MYFKYIRDLKPENILFISESPDSKLKVIDFGTSRKFDQSKQMTKRLGTVNTNL
jgi:calcium-dependent protein kinase